MSSSELRVVLDRPDSTFSPGETVRGEVLARSGDEVRCRALKLEWEWRTHGKGNVAKGKGGSMILAQEATWSPGGEYRYAFTLTAPRGPLTHRGTLVNLDWYLRAVADVPWAFDPKTESELLLVPGAGGDGSLDLGPGWKPLAPAKSSKPMGVFGYLVLAGFCSIFVAVGLFIMFGQGGIVGIPFGGIFVAAGLLVMGMSLKNSVAQRKVGAPEVDIEPSMTHAGGKVAVRVRLRPRSSFSLTGISATVLGQEVVVKGSGTNRTTHTHKIHEETKGLDPGGRAVDPGMEVAAEASFEIPAFAPSSFTVSDNAVSWKVSVHVGIDGWPDWNQDFPIGVLPPRRA